MKTVFVGSEPECDEASSWRTDRVFVCHIVGPDAGEIIRALASRSDGRNQADFDATWRASTVVEVRPMRTMTAATSASGE